MVNSHALIHADSVHELIAFGDIACKDLELDLGQSADQDIDAD
jgi:hypothetical protein